jgi:hypothetical protein
MFRNVRGRSVALAVFDECAFWQSELTANPDVEVYQAVTPSLATLPGSMLIGISTPYRRAGLLRQKHRDITASTMMLARLRSQSARSNPISKIVIESLRIGLKSLL